jgi:hypothetical protein
MPATWRTEPPEILKCRTTHVKAVGNATATGKSGTAAVAAARKAARAQRDLAVAFVRDTMKCPQDDPKCKGVCRKGKVSFSGFGSEVKRKRLAPGRWEADYTAWRSYDVACRCSG